MNKRALQHFAPKERNELRISVERRLERLGILSDSTYKNFGEWMNAQGGVEGLNHRLGLNYPEGTYKDLFNEYQRSGYDDLVEETAYTWFNRLMAIRYMEVNNVLPDRVNILSSVDGGHQPEILTDYDYLDINFQEIEILKFDNKEELAYKKLFIAATNKLGEVMPYLFDQLQGWTELLLPEKMLEEGSIIDRVVNNDGLTESFESGIEAVGWLYQFYNSELKNKVFSHPKSKKIEKSDIAPATQLFTPEWIVKYMVENSLGRFYIDMLLANPNETRTEKEIAESFKWEYYLENAKQTEDVNLIIKADRRAKEQMTPEDLKLIDPSMGSGHILVYAFDVFIQIYKDQGYSTREAVSLILEKNIFGLDIDKRAAQLSYFALMMKARSKVSRFFRKPVHPKVYDVIEVPISHIDKYKIFIEMTHLDKTKLEAGIKYLYESFQYGKELGSLIEIDPNLVDFAILESFLDEPKTTGETMQLSLEMTNWNGLKKELSQMICIAKVFAQKYEVGITNPPYMESVKFNEKLHTFTKKHYPDSASDMFAIFIERLIMFTEKDGYTSMITQHAFMFIGGYRKLRLKLKKNIFVNMVHLGTRAFEEIGGEKVNTTSFVLKNSNCKRQNGRFVRLVDYKNYKLKEITFLKEINLEHSDIVFSKNQNDFENIPGNPFAYWISDTLMAHFKNGIKMASRVEANTGLQTNNNDLFIRYSWEVNLNDIDFNSLNISESIKRKRKWFPHGKGKEFRRWYGNNELVVNFENSGEEIMKYSIQHGKGSPFSGSNYYFKKCLTWPGNPGENFSLRFQDVGFIHNKKGLCAFPSNDDDLYYILGMMNTKISNHIFKILNPTVSTGINDFLNIPLIFDEDKKFNIIKRAKENVEISKEDWDSFEVSWDFKKHPFIIYSDNNLRRSFLKWNDICNVRFQKLKTNEEMLNSIFIKIYGLSQELTSEIDDEELLKSIRKAEYKRDTRSFLSYFIGCLLGRYSLDMDGIAFAGGEYDSGNYQSFIPVSDGIVTFTDEKILADDVYERLKQFLVVIYGAETLGENLAWIAEGLGQKASQTAESTIRGYFIKDFYKDHLKIYKNRPIYWMIDSGKANGMKSLVYLHRYAPHTLGLVQNNHFVPLLNAWRTLATIRTEELENACLSVLAEKEKKAQLTVYTKRIEELEKFQDKLGTLANQEIVMDLDDGVKVNCRKFLEILHTDFKKIAK